MNTAPNDIPLSQDLVDLIKKTAMAEGRRPEQVVQDALRLYVSDNRWERALAYGRRQAQMLGYTEDDVERLIQECRAGRDSAS